MCLNTKSWQTFYPIYKYRWNNPFTNRWSKCVSFTLVFLSFLFEVHPPRLQGAWSSPGAFLITSRFWKTTQPADLEAKMPLKLVDFLGKSPPPLLCKVTESKKFAEQNGCIIWYTYVQIQSNTYTVSIYTCMLRLYSSSKSHMYNIYPSTTVVWIVWS